MATRQVLITRHIGSAVGRVQQRTRPGAGSVGVARRPHPDRDFEAKQPISTAQPRLVRRRDGHSAAMGQGNQLM